MLCDVFCCSPGQLLQAFAAQLSLPRYINCEENPLLDTATGFFTRYAPTRDSEQVQEHLDRQVSRQFYLELVAAVESVEEPEQMLRDLVARWSAAAAEVRRQVKEQP